MRLVSGTAHFGLGAALCYGMKSEILGRLQRPTTNSAILGTYRCSSRCRLPSKVTFQSGRLPCFH